jgi:TM2 domain-containing membrane protein YozV
LLNTKIKICFILCLLNDFLVLYSNLLLDFLRRNTRKIRDEHPNKKNNKLFCVFCGELSFFGDVDQKRDNLVVIILSKLILFSLMCVFGCYSLFASQLKRSWENFNIFREADFLINFKSFPVEHVNVSLY